MKASIVFFPNEAKKNLKTGKIPIYMRICYQAKKCECRLNAEITESEVLKWNPISLRIDERNSAINHLLERLNQKFNDFILLNFSTLPSSSAVAIRDFILGSKKSLSWKILLMNNTRERKYLRFKPNF